MCRILYVALIYLSDLSIVGFAFSTGYTGVIMDSKSPNKSFRKCSGFVDDIIVHSYSRHIWDVPACWYMEGRLWKVWSPTLFHLCYATNATQLLFASNIMLGITQLTAKLPIMVLYLQVLYVERKMKLFIKAAIALSCLVYIPHPVLVIVFQTLRSGETWTDLATNGRPQNMTYYAPVHGVCEVILNVWMLIIPMLVIRNLQITGRKKIQLAAVFLTGIM